MPQVPDQTKSNVLQQLCLFLHDCSSDFVDPFVIHGIQQDVRTSGLFKVDGKVNINRIFIPDFLLLIVKPVIGKKLQSFE